MISYALALLAIAGALLICWYAHPVGRLLRVMDWPDGDRKCHTQATPLVGGIAILVPLSIWLGANLCTTPAADPHLFEALLLCAAGVGVTGFADDQAPISPLSRMLLLIVFVGVTLIVDPELIAPVLNWGEFDDTAMPAWAFSALMIVSATGVVFVIWSICLMLVGSGEVVAVAAVLFFFSLTVLGFNLRGRLFLGNCGSYGVTFVLGILTMRTHAQGNVTVETVLVWFFIPVVDCLRLLVARLGQGRSPAAPDRDHFHHRLEIKLGPHHSLIAYIGLVAVTSIASALAPELSFLCIAVLATIYLGLASLAGSTPEQTSAAGAVADTAQDALRVFDAELANVVPISIREKLPERETASWRPGRTMAERRHT